MAEIGAVIDGKYKILDKIGQGGMSIVYLAMNERANKMWAVKEVRKDAVIGGETIRHRLIAETRILKQLKHKYLPEIADIIDDGGTFLIVMDYIQGKSLKAVLKESMEIRGRPIDAADVCRWGAQLCCVLDYLHTREAAVIYRDMKPANVILKPDGDISLIDFGTARIFKNGCDQDTVCLGTPGYAAPEQYGGSGQTGPRTDIYCLGATLHQLVTGRNPSETPFHFPKITQCRPQLLWETPKMDRDLLFGLEAIIDRCTSYDAAARYPSCKRLEYDLKHPEQLSSPYRRKLKNKAAAFGISAGMTVLFSAAALVGWHMEKLSVRGGCDYYLNEAATEESSEKAVLYKKAIALEPADERAYLGLLETLTMDHDFSEQDEQEMLSVLNSRGSGRSRSNKLYLQSNVSGYVAFAYQMGLAYYYMAGPEGDKPSAAGWFAPAAEADMKSLNFGKDDIYKECWQARAKILGRISSYYKYQLGAVDKMGDMEVSYKDYWDDLTSLMAEDIADKDNQVTELRLYHEIIYQIYTRTVEFKNEAELKRTQLTAVIEEIKGRISRMAGTQQEMVKTLIEDIQTDIEAARRHIDAVYQ